MIGPSRKGCSYWNRALQYAAEFSVMCVPHHDSPVWREQQKWSTYWIPFSVLCAIDIKKVVPQTLPYHSHDAKCILLNLWMWILATYWNTFKRQMQLPLPPTVLVHILMKKVCSYLNMSTKSWWVWFDNRWCQKGYIWNVAKWQSKWNLK